MGDDSIPVTVLSGTLGAGKTTLLNHLLSHAGDRKLAVLVNDMGELNVDAELVAEQADAAGVAELSNGCICCELRDDLETEVMRLARSRNFDYLVVESSGISEPAPVAKLFTTGSASARYDLDALVTVVNARQFRDAFDPDEPVERAEVEDGETRPLSDLIVEQVEFCDILVVNKTDLVTDEELAGIDSTLTSVQPEAKLLASTHGQVDPDELLDTQLFDLGAVQESAGWKQALADDHGEEHDHHERGHDHHHDENHDHNHHGHRHPDEEYGVTSFVYRRRRPFHPGRFEAFLESLSENVVRSKGFFWTLGADETIYEYGQAGRAARVTIAGEWVASRPEVEQELYRMNHSDIDWDDEWGDRETRLVFIGTELDEGSLTSRLDDCLATDGELDSREEEAFESPFPTDEDGVFELVDW